MKKENIILIFILLLFSVGVYAQPGNHKVEILAPVQHTSYEPAGVLTVNMDNKLRFESADASVQRFLVNTNQGTVKQDGKDFIITPDKTGELALAIYNYDDVGNPVLIEERIMTVVSSPAASIAGKSGGNISKAELVNAEKVSCSGNYTITEYKLTVSGKGVGYHEFQRKGDTISTDMIAAINELPVGGKIFIEYIRAKPEDSEATRQIAPLSFTLIE